MKIRESIIKLANSNDQYTNLDDNTFMLKHPDGVIIAFNAQDVINEKYPKYSYDVNISTSTFEDEMDNSFSYRLAGTIQLNNLSLDSIIETGIIPSIYELRKLSNNEPIMLKISQWGGQGGQGVGGIGQGLGIGNPMSGGINFDNPIVRIQFDKSLEMTRKSPEKNGWFQPLEGRMQENPLYGHKRNEKDWNLKNYRMTYKERMQEKKKQFLQRMIENREKFDQMIDEHSIASIKASPIDPKYYVPMEEKLKEKRHQEDKDDKRKNYHGPESQFTHFPPAPKQVTAQTVIHNGITSVFDNDPEMMQNDSSAYPDYVNGRYRIRKFPWMMYGPTREKDPLDLKEDNNLLWGGNWINGPSNDKGGTITRDYLVDSYATGKNPGEIQETVFTPDMLPGVIQEMRDHLKFQDDAVNNPQKVDDNEPIEKKLKSKHRAPDLVGVTPPQYDIQTSPYPWATENFFMPQLRKNKAGG